MTNRPHRARPPLSRREMLARCANGFGALALAALASADDRPERTDPLAPRAGHFPAKAKSVIFLFMDGGPSQLDTFDPKPRLHKEAGQKIPIPTPTTVFNISDKILPSPYEFRQYGQSGTWVSELFPNVAECADDLCIVRSMVADHSEHTAANYFLHSGSGFQGRPSMGAWVTYGLGSESADLPGFIVLESGLIPPGGMDCFSSGFLPATYQGTLFRKGEHPVADLLPRESSVELQRAKLDLLRDLNEQALDRYHKDSNVEATIKNYELAFRMQAAVPGLLDLSSETELTRKMYGLDDPDTEEFGRECLLARRLVERGVRFVELLSPFRKGIDRWDQHSGLENGHRVNSKAVDKPIAALLKDLKGRGLLDQTLVVWGGEFGRTPTAQMPDGGYVKEIGRDHNPFGFTMWLAGGGTKPGITYGATDDYGYYAVEDKMHLHDLHATMLHLLGIDHKQLTYPFSGRQMRLTDVHGNVIREILT